MFGSFITHSVIGVSINPGWMQFTRMPCGVISADMLRVSDLLGLRHVRDVVHRDVGAFVGEYLRDAAPDPARGAGDQRAFAFQLQDHAPRKPPAIHDTRETTKPRNTKSVLFRVFVCSC